MDLSRLTNVILFQAERKLKFLAIASLRVLEERHLYIKQLENTLTKMGVGEYDKSDIEYAKDRKYILDLLNDGLREFQHLDDLVK